MRKLDISNSKPRLIAMKTINRAKLTMAMIAATSTACAVSTSSKRPAELTKPYLILTASPSIIMWSQGYVHFTVRLQGAAEYLQCHRSAWVYGDSTTKLWETSDYEPFKTSQQIHLYGTGVFNPRFVIECATGVYYAELNSPIKVGQRE